MESMGERIRRMRIDRGLTQEELGKVIGIQKATMQKYECGSTHNMKRTQIKALADFFGVSPAYIMCLEEEQSEDITIMSAIKTMTVEELQQLNDYIDFIISKRKK